MLKLTLEHDEGTESPLEYGGWRLVSFRRGSNDVVSKYVKSVDACNEITFADVGLARKVATGTAFVLSCYEHSQVQWGLQGEVHYCRWDTARIAGMLIWEDRPADLPYYRKDPKRTYTARAEYARDLLKSYTQWCNGDCYWYRLEDTEIGSEDSCGGFIGQEYFVEAVREAVAGRKIDEIDGDAAWLVEWEDFQGKPEVAPRAPSVS